MRRSPGSLETLIFVIPVILFVAFALGAVIAIAVFIIRKVLDSSPQSNHRGTAGMEKITTKAELVEKQRNNRGNTRGADKLISYHQSYALSKQKSPFINYFTFKLPDGSKILLEVSDWIYTVFKEGDEGILSYIGIQFVEFKKDA